MEVAKLQSCERELYNYNTSSNELFIDWFLLFHSSALDARLKDDSFPEGDFDVMRGNLRVTWERIAPYPYLFYVFENLSCLC